MKHLPVNLQKLLQSGLAHHQAGRLQQAEQAYRGILAADPRNPDASNLLGVIAFQAGKFDVAVDLISRAIQHAPHQPDFFNNLGNALKGKGNLAEAVAAFNKAIHLAPGHVDAHYNLGNAYLAQGNPGEAAAAYRKALGLRPGFAEGHYNLGNAYLAQGNSSEAAAAYREALALQPDFVEAHYNLGNAYLAQGNPGEAAASFDRALVLKPDLAEAHNNLGKISFDHGRLQEAEVSLRRALAINPGYVSALVNLGITLQEQGKNEEALACYMRAHSVKPDVAEVHCNMGNVFFRLGRCADAIACYRRALQLKQDYPAAHSHIIGALHYLPSVSQAEIFREAREWDRLHAEPFKPKQRPHANSRDRNRRLRIGYVSPDFRSHSINAFFEPLLAAHDRDRFEIFLYANVIRPDNVSKRLQAEADRWTSIVKMSDDEAAEQIRADRIDILVDLAKHSADNRLLLFARKPAPVQATWLGYPSTTGMEAMDYRIVDAITHPEGKTDSLNSETLVRLEHGYFCFTPGETGPEVAPSPATACGRITFGSFSNLLKIHPGVLAAWSEILKQVDDSRLVMLGKGFGDRLVRQHFAGQFAGHGIDAERVDLLPSLPYEEYLAMHGKIDIALDPFPYNGHTTTCISLWMGVPMVTLRGEADCSRVGASIMTRIGLTELIAENRQEYVDKTAELAGDLGRLAALRSGLRARLRNSSLCDARGFARSMEAAYVRMWERYVAADAAGKQG